METGDREVKAGIYSLATTANDAIVFLEEINGIRLLPIWIGPVEGQAIAIKFSGIPLPRPFTHDLILSIISNFDITVEKVVIDNVRENTFYSTVYMLHNGQRHEIDARPSDAIAIAVRAACQIYVLESIFAKSQTLSKPITQDEVSQFKTQLKDLKPADIFGQLKKENKEKKEPPPSDGSDGEKQP